MHLGCVSQVPFGATVEYHPIPAKDISRLHQLGPKVLPGIFLGYVLHAGLIWKGHILVADIGIGGDRRFRTPRPKAQCKGIVDAAKKWKLHFPRMELEWKVSQDSF